MQKKNQHKHTSRSKAVSSLLKWYANHARDLPWRNTSNPYRILVSEVMLQQTQVSRVLIKYGQFLHRFPTIRALSRAGQREVVVAWKGMGYNNRAARLHRLARAIIERHGGRFPRDYQSLVALPGVGRYTANALLSSAFKIDVPTVDVNVRRFLSRAFWKMSSTLELRSDQDIWRLTEELLPRGMSYQWNQALMDIGATICTLQRPRCEICPGASSCKSKQSLKETHATKAKREPSFDGIPNRIYRGRIIEELRKKNGAGSISFRNLGQGVHPTFSSRHSKWLESLLNSLRRDGLILIQENGSPTRKRVRLA